MRTALATLFFLGCTASAASAQSTEQPAFEVASIKALPPESPGGRAMSTGAGIIKQDPSIFSIQSVSLSSLLMRAYGLKPIQLTGPDWMDQQFYDLNAKPPSGATPDQIPGMLQRLITERFRPTLRWDTKQETGYALVVDRGGPKFALSADQSTHDGEQPDVASSISVSDKTVMKRAPMGALASSLSGMLREPVVDSTGLQGRYDITLNLSFKDMSAALRGPSPSDDGYTPTSIFDAVREIGLRLEPQKVEVKHLTVIKADRIPTGN